MKIDGNTKTDDFRYLEGCLAEGEGERLTQAAVLHHRGKDGFWSMTVAEFFSVVGGDFEPLLRDGGSTVYDEYCVRGFGAFVSLFVDTLHALTLQPTAEERACSNGCKDMTFEEATYIFLREYFGLPSFAAVETLTLADYVLAKKDHYNKGVAERNARRMMARGGKQ